MIRRLHRRRRPATDGNTRLKLTSMMDILTTLLLFVLKAFVAEGEVSTPPPGVTLPSSSAEDAPEVSVVVAVSADNILVGGRPVASVPEALADQDLLLDGLDATLVAAREQMEHLAELRGVEAVVPKVTIQGDRAMEFRLLEKVMYTCGEAGYGEVALAVVQESI
jgi:biopolymer transport protein ExbD